MPSALELARLADPGASDEDLVVGIAGDLIDRLDLEPPIDLRVVASLAGVKRVETRLGLDCAACLVPAPDGLRILLRATDSDERRNFSGMHEVAHTFMPGYDRQVQRRCDPGELLADGGIESLCDIAASELLMPRRHFVQDLGDRALDFDTVQRLRGRYRSSLEATARRMAQLSSRPARVLRLEVRNKKHEASPDAQPKLRASCFHPASGVGPEIPALKSLADTDPLQAAVRDGAFSGPTPLSGLRQGPRMFWAEALSCPYYDVTSGSMRERVLVIVQPMSAGSGH